MNPLCLKITADCHMFSQLTILSLWNYLVKNLLTGSLIGFRVYSGLEYELFLYFGIWDDTDAEQNLLLVSFVSFYVTGYA